MLKMDYNKLFSAVVTRSKASAIRELLKLLCKPEIISFAGGLPDPDMFPTKDVSSIMQDVLTNSPKEALQYGATEGQDSFKQELVCLLQKTEGITCESGNLLIVSAAQQALDMVARLFLNPGDHIITAAPTYLGALQAFHVAGADIIGAKSDNYGVLAEDIEAILAALQKKGEVCKFIYLVPDFQNPTGTTIPQERRLKILEIAKKYGTLIVEDSPYRQVRFEGTAPDTFYKLDNGEGNVITLFTFSKVFVPGFRLGYILGPQEIIKKLVILKQAMDLCTSPILQLAAKEYLKRGLLLEHIKHIVAAYKEKRDLMLQMLKEHMPEGVSWTHPEGGLFLWLTMPKQLDAAKLLPRALENNVAYVSGVDFYPQADVHNDMRLNFSYSSREQIIQGVKRLAQTIKENL